MEILRARTLGMCMGVRRAERIAREAAKRGRVEGRPVFTYGPLIHNPQAVEALAEIGVGVLDCGRFEAGELDALASGAIVVIRAHGAPRKTLERLAILGASVVDATCPRVSGGTLLRSKNPLISRI